MRAVNTSDVPLLFERCIEISDLWAVVGCHSAQPMCRGSVWASSTAGQDRSSPMCCSRLHVSLVDTTHGAVLLNSDWVMVGAFKGKIFGSQHIIYVRLFPVARAASEVCLLFDAEKHR